MLSNSIGSLESSCSQEADKRSSQQEGLRKCDQETGLDDEDKRAPASSSEEAALGGEVATDKQLGELNKEQSGATATSKDREMTNGDNAAQTVENLEKQSKSGSVKPKFKEKRPVPLKLNKMHVVSGEEIPLDLSRKT